MDEAMTVENLHVSYYDKEVITNVSFSCKRGKLIGIIGPNGAGKSTLMKAMLGLIPKDSGTVTLLGRAVKEVRKNVAYVPQRSNIDWDFPITVFDTVLIGTYPRLGVFRRPKKAEKALAYECLKKVGMEQFHDRQIGELSGGQQQRVFLARALAQQSDLFFLDEPFVGIDVTSEEMIIRILKELRAEGKTVLVVHHDLTKAEEYFDELLLINRELVGSGAVEEVLQRELIAKAYGSQFSMLESIGVGI